MGQIKGNPASDRSPQNQAYTNLYGVGSAAYRDMGSKPVMIDDQTTLDAVVDSGSLKYTQGYAKDTDLTDGTINAAFNTLTANEYYVTIYSSSILFSSGSTLLGDSLDDRHQITGSLNVTGSTSFLGTHTLSGSNTIVGNTLMTGTNTIIGNTVMSGSIDVSGSSNFHNSLFIVTGSQFYTGSSDYKGNQTITGSLDVNGNINVASGSEFYLAGNRLFNWGQFSDTSTQSGSANTAYSMKFNTTDFTHHIVIENGTRIKVEHTGIYNLQFSAQLSNTANTNITFDIWLAYTGSNVVNSNTQLDVNKSAAQLGRSVAAWNYMMPIKANDYIELKWSCNAATGQLVAIGPQTTPDRPAVPSVIATLTQIG
jgi:hypothetical protein